MNVRLPDHFLIKYAVMVTCLFIEAAGHNDSSSSSSGISGDSSSEEVPKNITQVLKITLQVGLTKSQSGNEGNDGAVSYMNSSLGDVGEHFAVFCQVVQLKNLYYYFNVIGNQYHYGMRSIHSCLYLCVSHNLEGKDHSSGENGQEHCRAVNYFAYHNACQLLTEGIEDIDLAERETFGRMKGAVHVYIQYCFVVRKVTRVLGPDVESSTTTTTITTTTATTTTTTSAATTSVLPAVTSTASTSKIGCGISTVLPSTASHFDMARIIRGTEAVAHSWPWVILYKLRGRYQRSFCGATLLRVGEDVDESDIVLTAAHCVTRPETQAVKPINHDPAFMSVVAGDHRRNILERSEVHRRVTAVRFHPRFRFAPYTGAVNDIAILKLQTPIRFNDVIRPICLPDQNDPIPSNMTCVATGWGRNNSRYVFVMPDALQQLMIPVQDAKTCRMGWGHFYREKEMICAGSLRGTASTCQGDSGGMLGCKSSNDQWVQYGVVSFGVGGSCLQPYKPAVFTRVSSYVEWIRKTMAEMSHSNGANDQ